MYTIEDEKKRTIIILSEAGEVAIARFPDMSDKLKELIIGFYEISAVREASEVERLKQFLNYKTNEHKFCS